jgi:7-cyano-7-deazaguanine synthase
MEKQKVLLLFSGGFDSVVLLHDLIRQNYDPTLLFINYGQKPLKAEMEHTQYWVDKFKLRAVGHTIPQFSWSKSAMFENGEEYDDSKDNDYIELRNLIFFSYASSMAQSEKIPTIASAILWNNFEDTTPNFCKSFDAMLFNMAEIDLYTPYMYMHKRELADFAVERGFNIGEILSNSISCNITDTDLPCGKCQECTKILEIKSKFIK